VAADEPLELETFLGTVPGMVYRSRLAPEPYFIEFVSDEMTSIAGYSAADFVGPEPKRVWSELIHPDDRDTGRAKVVEAPADGSITEVEYRVRRADGSYAWVLSRFRKLLGDDGSLWVHGAALDVTARHEAEELRRRLEAEHARASALEESRARIVEAGDEARRRLERDLHDGAQQRLIVSLMALRRAAQDADGGGAAFLAQGTEQLEEGIVELRELARGIHPSHLSEHGLAHAAGLLAKRAPVPVDVDIPEERLPQSVETALYFTIAEGLTNVAKYADATRARVEVAVSDGLATAEVADDGRGGATAAAGGSGLRGLADRLEAIGGSLEVESPPGGGTVLRARVPL
jgi:PAS domain S-box-containing protein